MAFNDERGLEFVMRDVFGERFHSFLRNIRGLIEFITNFFDDQVEDSSQEQNESPFQGQELEPIESIVIVDNKERPMLKRCTSCFEERIQEYVVTSCRHTACKACAMQWLGVHRTCWYCRQPISDQSPVFSCQGNPSCKEEDMIGHVI